MEETILHDLPEGVAYLEAYDRFCVGVQRVVDMPDRTIDQLHRFFRQGDGRLSKPAPPGEFKALGDEELSTFEALFQECLGGLSEQTRVDE